MKYYLILFTIFSLISCNSREMLPKNENAPLVDQNTISNLSESIKTKPKLFLKYWDGMSEEEFDTVTKILISEGKLEHENLGSIYYLVPGCRTEIKPTFTNNSLKQLEILDGNCLYSIYQEKYSLPDLKEQQLIQRRYMEKNPDYSPIMTYMSKNDGMKNLPNYFFDNSTYDLKTPVNLSIPQDGLKEKILPTSPLIIEKGDNVIVFEQSFYTPPTPLTKYSLDISTEMKQYKDEHPLLSFSEEGKFIQSNSKYVIKEVLRSSVIKITYKSKSNYNKEITASNAKEKQVKDQQIKRTQEREQKLQTVMEDL